MKCIHCDNFVPEKLEFCPFCGNKLENKSLENKSEDESNTQLNTDSNVEENVQISKNKKSYWYEFSVEFIKNNTKDIIIISLMNNPIAFILSLGLVSFWYNAYLYQFAIAYEKNEKVINFNYKNTFMPGVKLSLVSFLNFTPFLIIILIITAIFIFISYNLNRDPIYIIFWTISYITLLSAIIISSLFGIILRNLTIIELLNYPYQEWLNFKHSKNLEIFVKVYKLFFKNIKLVIVVFILFLIIWYGVLSVVNILCYCTCGLIMILYILPFLVLDILFLGYLLDEFKKNELNKKGN